MKKGFNFCCLFGATSALAATTTITHTMSINDIVLYGTFKNLSYFEIKVGENLFDLILL